MSDPTDPDGTGPGGTGPDDDRPAGERRKTVVPRALSPAARARLAARERIIAERRAAREALVNRTPADSVDGEATEDEDSDAAARSGAAVQTVEATATALETRPDRTLPQRTQPPPLPAAPRRPSLPGPAAPAAPKRPPLRARPLEAYRPPTRRGGGGWFSLLTFLLFVAVPGGMLVHYLWYRAADEYHSVTAFSVRSEASSTSMEMPIKLPGGLGGPSDADVLNEFLRSQQLVEKLDARLNLREIYNKRPDDWLFSFGENRSIEDLVWYWGWATHVSYDQMSGLIEVRALAFEPEDARRIAAAVLEESTALVNSLSLQARTDAISYAQKDLDEAQERLKAIRLKLREFRDKVQTADPVKDVEAQMGVLSALQQSLAEALVAQAELSGTTRPGDPRIEQGERRIRAIEAQIETEKRNLGSGGTNPEAEDLARTIGIFEELKTDLGFAEAAYVAAQEAFDLARIEARRQSSYLAPHISPTLSETPQYPQRLLVAGLVIMVLTVGWGLMVLLVMNIWDRR